MNSQEFRALDWHDKIEILEDPKTDIELWEKANDLAGSWETCAVGKGIFDMTQYTYGITHIIRSLSEYIIDSYGYESDSKVSEQVDLFHLGSIFADNINDEKFIEAKNTLMAIESVISENEEEIVAYFASG